MSCKQLVPVTTATKIFITLFNTIRLYLIRSAHQCFFSFMFHFSFSFSYSFGGIFVLVLAFLYVNVVRLMTTLSK